MVLRRRLGRRHHRAKWCDFVPHWSGLRITRGVGLAFLVNKYKKQSLVNFSLGGAIVISAISMSVLEVVNLVRDVREGRSLGFNSVCA